MSGYVCPTSRGYKPHTAAEILGVGKETLRYWRAHMDPKPARSHYPAGVVLAYRIIKTLVRNRHIPVQTLERCDWTKIFHMCETLSMEKLRDYYVELDENNSVVSCKREADWDDDPFSGVSAWRIAAIIDGHLTALATLGRSDNVVSLSAARTG